MPNGVGCPGEARRLRDGGGSGSIAVDKWEIDRPNDRGIALPYGVIATMYLLKWTSDKKSNFKKVAWPNISHLSHHLDASRKSLMDWKMEEKKFSGHLLFEIWISYLNFTLVGIMVVVHRVIVHWYFWQPTARWREDEVGCLLLLW
jgi:hypothetical protein